jgi:hypothetical protein
MQRELPDNLKGLEFDWYAIDKDGHIGLFVTFGEGWVPESVADNADEHNAVTDVLDAPHIGSEEVWLDYARLGFFVFDWGKSGFSYCKVAEPIGDPDPALVSRLNAIKGFPRLPMLFAATTEVSSITDF